MNENFVFGGIISLAAHAALVWALLTFGAPEPAKDHAEEAEANPSVETADPAAAAAAAAAPAAPEPVTPVAPVAPAPVRAQPRPARAVPTPAASALPTLPGSEPETEDYVVKSGDNLSRIARDCGSTVDELADLNGTTVKKLANLRIGQVIKIRKK